MARARNIKPGFYLNEQLANCSIFARYIFPGLWMQADRLGRLEDRPLRLKASLLPYDNADINELLNELEKAELIIRYEVEGSKFIQVVSFEKHQNPHMREPKSTIPAPDKHSAKQVQAPDKHDAGPAESPSLIPESREKTLSDKSDVDPPEKKKLSEACAEVLTFLNEKTGRRYRPVKANIEMIAARLKEGATVDECRQVIAKKCREWRSDEKMEAYLRPKTLFNRTNFAQYQGELT